MRKTLPQVKLSLTAFTLKPGEARSVSAALVARPGSGSLYGAIDVARDASGRASA